MTFTGNNERALLALAAMTYRDEILAHLGRDRRYLGAMVANALDIASRMLDGGAAEAERRLLQKIYVGKERSLADFARDIRVGAVGDATHGDLRDTLRGLVVAELSERNPKFLESRAVD